MTVEQPSVNGIFSPGPLGGSPSTSHQFFVANTSSHTSWKQKVIFKVTKSNDGDPWQKEYFILQPIIHMFHWNTGNAQESGFCWFFFKCYLQHNKVYFNSWFENWVSSSSFQLQSQQQRAALSLEEVS